MALRHVLTALPGDFPTGIVVVQHMPPVFTQAFADRLNSLCALAVKEAENGEPILPGHVYIAPGDFHLTVSRFGTGSEGAAQPGPAGFRAPALGGRADALGGPGVRDEGASG